MYRFITPAYKLDYSNSGPTRVLDLPDPDLGDSHQTNRDIAVHVTRANSIRTLVRGSHVMQKSFSSTFNFSGIDELTTLRAQEFFTKYAPGEYLRISYFKTPYQFDTRFPAQDLSGHDGRRSDFRTPEQDWVGIYISDSFNLTSEGTGTNECLGTEELYSFSLILRRWTPGFPEQLVSGNYETTPDDSYIGDKGLIL